MNWTNTLFFKVKNLDKVIVTEFEQTFHSPLKLRGPLGEQTLNSRQGLSLEGYKKDEKKILWAEFLPLPSYHKMEYLEGLNFLEQADDLTLPRAPGPLSSFFDQIHLALEKAPDFSKQKKISSNVLLSQLEGLSLKKEETLKTLKIKMNWDDRDKEVGLLGDLLKKNPMLKIRLDFNKTMKASEINHLLSPLIPYRDQIDYLEDPYLHQIDELTELHFPYALDEDLFFSKEMVKEFLKKSKAQALILKPTLLGGPKESLDWLHFCQQKKIRAILSSCYDGPAGQWWNRFLAPENEIHGLATDHLFHLTPTKVLLEKIRPSSSQT